jgi:hypothetical protein
MDNLNIYIELLRICDELKVTNKQDVGSIAPHEHYRLHRFYDFLLIIIFPIITLSSMYIATFFNPCLVYSGSLYISIISIYGVIVLISFFHISVYSYLTWYCSPRIIKIHLFHCSVYFLMVSSALGFYNLYAFDNNFLYFLGSSISSMGSLIEYFICVFQRHHFYYCKADGCNELPAEPVCASYSYDDCFTVLGVFMVMLLISFIIVPVNLSDQLDVGSRPLEFCTDIS